MPATRTRATKAAAENGVEEAPAVPAFTTTDDGEERVPFFTIDGEQFTRPKEIGQGLFYLGLDRLRDEGAHLASIYINRLILGAEDHDRLRELVEERKLTDDQFDQITGMISDLFFNKQKDDTEGKDETTTSAPTSATS